MADAAKEPFAIAFLMRFMRISVIYSIIIIFCDCFQHGQLGVICLDHIQSRFCIEHNQYLISCVSNIISSIFHT